MKSIIIFILIPVISFSQKGDYGFDIKGVDGTVIEQRLDTTSGFFSAYFEDSINKTPFTGKAIRKYRLLGNYDSLNIINGFLDGFNKEYSLFSCNKKDTSITFVEYKFFNAKNYLFVDAGYTNSYLQYFDYEAKLLCTYKIEFYKIKKNMIRSSVPPDKIVLNSEIIYNGNNESHKDKIIFNDRKDLEKFFIRCPYYNLLKAFHFFGNFPSEISVIGNTDEDFEIIVKDGETITQKSFHYSNESKKLDSVPSKKN